MPKVSIIIPVYKAESYIEQCARTLFEQTLDDLEYIFVDDCSPDDSIEVMERVLKEFPSRYHQVKVIHHNVNHGVSVARQHGVVAATGQYIIHCDPDDWVDTEMYADLYNYARRTAADVVICDCFYHYNGKSVIKAQQPERLESISVLEGIAGRSSHCLHGCLWNKLISAKYYKKISFPNVDFCEDAYILFQILSLKPSISYLHKSLYHYRTDVPSSLVKQKDKRANDSDLRLIKSLQQLKKASNYERYNDCIDSYIVRIIFTRAFSWGILTNEQFSADYSAYTSCISKNQDLNWIKKILLKLAMSGNYHFAHKSLLYFIKLKSLLLPCHH